MEDFRLCCNPPLRGKTEICTAKNVQFHVKSTSTVEIPDLKLFLCWRLGDSEHWFRTEFVPLEYGLLEGNKVSCEFHAKLDTKKSREVEFKVCHTTREGGELVAYPTDGHTGSLFITSPKPPKLFEPVSLWNFFSNFDKTIESISVDSSIEDTSLVLVSAAAKAKSPEYTVVSLGRAQNVVHWISLERLMSFWMEPNQGKGLLNTPRDSYMVAFQRTDGTHVVLLPISGLRNECQAHLKTDEKTHNLMLHIKNDSQVEGKGQIILGHSTDSLDKTIDAVFAYVRTLFQEDYKMSGEEKKEIGIIDPEWFEEWTDGLFYCTWNAMYDDVTEDKIMAALDGLHDQDIHVNGVIIDDGWQDIDDQRRWKSFTPSRERFPNGLGGTVTRMKKKYPYIKHVGVWHALMGYWNGMSPDSWLSDNYRMVDIDMRKITVPKGLEQMHIIDGSDIRRMYDDFYRYLAQEGISVIKCDVQAAPDDISHSFPEKRLVWRDYQDALHLASMKYMQRRVIYCMSHVSNIFLYSLLQKNAPPACVRNSNDFFPDQDDSHAWHIFWNANNDLYTSRLNVFPDWDMFDTAHPQARLHAIARSLSGGPILITDQTNSSDSRLIAQMVSKTLSDNKCKVLRFDRPARNRYPYVNFNDSRFTKVLNSSYDITTCGAFNTTRRRTVEGLCLVDFGILTKDSYAIIEFSTRQVRVANAETRHRVLFVTDLSENGVELYTAAPLVSVHGTTRQCAVLGLLDKFASGVGISWWRLLETGHPILEVQVGHLGLLGVYINFTPNLDRLLVTIAEIVVPAESVTFEREVVAIDLVYACEKMDLMGKGSSNEVNVKIYLRD